MVLVAADRVPAALLGIDQRIDIGLIEIGRDDRIELGIGDRPGLYALGESIPGHQMEIIELQRLPRRIV